MPEWKISEVDDLFDNKHYQSRISAAVAEAVRKYVSGPLKVAVAVMAVLGVTSTSAIWWFGRQLAELQRQSQMLDARIEAQLKESQQKVDRASAQAEEQATAAQRAAVRAEGDLAKTRAQASETRNSAELAAQTIGLLQGSMAQTSDLIRDQAQAVTATLTDVRRLQIDAERNQAAASKAQLEAEKSQADIRAKQQKVDEGIALLDQSNAKVADLRQKTQELSVFKTFEFVTLRSHSRKPLRVSVVEPEADGRLQTVNYNLTFFTEGLRRPFKLALGVAKGDGPSQTLEFDAIEVATHDRPAVSYCVCGTPLAFTSDNYVNTPFVKDFATLKVVGRTDACQAPTRGPASCPSNGTPTARP